MIKKVWRAFVGLFNKKRQETVEEVKLTARKWTDSQIEELKRLYLAGTSKREICKLLGRTVNSVNHKITDIFGNCKTVK